MRQQTAPQVMQPQQAPSQQTQPQQPAQNVTNSFPDYMAQRLDGLESMICNMDERFDSLEATLKQNSGCKCTPAKTTAKSTAKETADK